MQKIFTECRIKHVVCKNRLVFAPTTVGKVTADFYEELAAGGVGMIVLADLSVVSSMMGDPDLSSMASEQWFRQVIEACHRHGCLVSAQLFHPEYDVEYMRTLYVQARAGQGVSPSQAREALAESTMHYCDELTLENIEKLIEAFGAAAARAERMGFDMVQIHGDRLVGSFTSPLFNHRTDCFGNHMEFSRRIVECVRQTVQDIPVDYKLTIRMEEKNLGRGGISQSEIPKFVRMLDVAGVDAYHVTLANHTDVSNTIPGRNHPQLKEDGCFAELAKEVKRYTDHPVCAVGKLQKADMMEELLDQDIDLVAMSRQLVADPEWPCKVREGRQDIRYCLYCNSSCMDSIRSGRPITCVLRKEQ